MKKYILEEQNSSANFKIGYKKELNKDQFKVVTGAEGPCLVLAGAGSGKTRTLVYRVAYLIEKRIDPKNILLVTFTNKAAHEMLNRVEALLKYKPKNLWGGTFHHIGNRILRRYARKIGYNNNFTILDQDDSKNLLKSCIGELNINMADKYFPKPDVIHKIISFAKNSQGKLKTLLETRYDYLRPETHDDIIRIAKFYEQKKKDNNLMDFDDLLSKWLKLLKDSPETCQKLSNQFKYILVDEYQDTNKIQGEIVNLLAQVHQNILVVGDDAQSIYSFRAATVSNILDFPKMYENAKTYRLETNYRSIPEVLNLANNSIKNNQDQFEKELKSIRKSGDKPTLVNLTDSVQQAEFICQRILELQEQGVSLDEIAVLFRAAFQSIDLELELNKRNIPYVMRGGIRFFEQAHIKDIIAFLRILANFKDELSWKRILEIQEGIGPSYSQRIWSQISVLSGLEELLNYNLSFELPDKAQASFKIILDLLKNIKKIEENFIASTIKAVLDSDYKEYLKNNYENYLDRIEDLEQFANFALKYDDLDRFLTDVTLSENFRGETVTGYEEQPDEVLVLSTIHQAKGLEWKAVFIIGLTEGQFPHYKVIENPGELDEERRLFYVASTRAKDYLYLTYPTFSSNFSLGGTIHHASRFINELDSDLYDEWEIEDKSHKGGILDFYLDEDREEDVIEYD